VRGLSLVRCACLGVAIAGCLILIRSAHAADAPKVVITALTPDGGTVHVIGFLEGNDLRSAGIFDRGEKLKDIHVAGTPGSQRVNFDFAIEAPSPTMMIEVTDGMGQSASAPILSSTAPPPTAAAANPAPASAGAGEDTAAVPAAPPPEGSGNAVEIPRYGGSAARSHQPNPRFVGEVGNPMTNVEIGVMSVLPVFSKPGSYEVTGQIVGAGVRRAGIYVGGRPVWPIPVATGTFTPFDVIFPLTGGRNATIRAYGAGNEYIELPINVDSPAAMYNNPYARPRSPLINPYGPPP
jgi:hypothetical protein